MSPSDSFKAKGAVDMTSRGMFAGVGGGLLSFGIATLLHLMKPDISFLDSLMISLSLAIGLVMLALIASGD